MMPRMRPRLLHPPRLSRGIVPEPAPPETAPATGVPFSNRVAGRFQVLAVAALIEFRADLHERAGLRVPAGVAVEVAGTHLCERDGAGVDYLFWVRRLLGERLG